MRSMGAGPDDIERVRVEWEAREAVLQDCLVEVYPENVPYLRALLLLQDQWEFPDGFGGGRLAVSLQEREVAMRCCGIPTDDIGHARMGVMLAEARAALLAQRKREMDKTR